MKFKSIASFLFIASTATLTLHGASSISGTALLNVVGVNDGDLGVVIVDTSGTGFDTSALSSLAAGANLTDSATYAGFEVLTTNFSADLGGFIVFEVNANNFDVVSQPIVTGDAFGILTFDGASTTAAAGTSFEIFTDATWLIPNDSTSPSFGSEYTFLNGNGPNATGTVVPEPSAFALLAGAFGIAAVMVRRRR